MLSTQCGWKALATKQTYQIFCFTTFTLSCPFYFPFSLLVFHFCKRGSLFTEEEYCIQPDKSSRRILILGINRGWSGLRSGNIFTIWIGFKLHQSWLDFCTVLGLYWAQRIEGLHWWWQAEKPSKWILMVIGEDMKLMEFCPPQQRISGPAMIPSPDIAHCLIVS